MTLPLKRALACVILYLLFFLLCFLGTGSDKKNIRSFYSYPDEIQDRIREAGALPIPKKTSYAVSFLSNTLIFTVVFVLIGLLTRDTSFWYYLALGEGLNLFDLLVIDLLWWQHTKRVRFTGFENPKDYLGARKHVKTYKNQNNNYTIKLNR